MFLNKNLLKKLSVINEKLSDLKNCISYETNKNIARYQTAMYFNQKAFSEFKGCFPGRDIVIVAAGPSAKKIYSYKKRYLYGYESQFFIRQC